MGYTAEKVIEIAEGEVGYCEKATNSGLDSQTGNAGHNHYTKYARDLLNAGYYNGNKQGAAWCDQFVDWTHYKAAGGSKTLAEFVECQTGNLGAGCSFSAGYFKALGRLDRVPKIGDQVFFLQGGSYVHTGLVTQVNGNAIHTIEGNSGDKVKEHDYSLSDSYVGAFGHPRYDPSTSTAEATKTTAVKYNGSVKGFQTWLNDNYSAGLAVDGAFGPLTQKAAIKAWQSAMNKAYGCGLAVDGVFKSQSSGAAKAHLVKITAFGDLVYIIQGMLYCYGYNPNGLDGIFGSGTKAALTKFQAAKQITADGTVGAESCTKFFAA